MNWLSVAALVLLIAGQVKLLTVALNWISAWPFRHLTLKVFRGVHDLLLLAAPWLTGWQLGCVDPRLVYGGAWSDLPGWGLLVCGWGGIGLWLLCADTWRWQTYRDASAQQRLRTTTFDVQEELVSSLDAAGPDRWLARLPGNQQFHLQVNERLVSIPGLKASAGGLRIAHLSDTHFRGSVDLPYFEFVFQQVAKLNADLVFFTGDLLDNPACIKWVSRTFGTLNAPLGCYFVLGNHDWYEHAEDHQTTLERYGWRHLGGQSISLTFGDQAILLTGTEVPWLGADPEIPPVKPDELRILVSHSPDQLKVARREGFQLMMAGHTHGGQIRLPLFGPVFSPSRYGVKYSGGLYWRSPTLLHVSRGISGREPLRFGCVPEVTLLELKPA